MAVLQGFTELKIIRRNLLDGRCKLGDDDRIEVWFKCDWRDLEKMMAGIEKMINI